MRPTAFLPTVTEDPRTTEGSPFSDIPRFSEPDDESTGAIRQIGGVREARTGRYSADEIASLSTERLMAMSRRDLIDVIRSVRGGHLRPGVLERLPMMDAETLRRLVFLTRRFCRNQQRLNEDTSTLTIRPYCR